MAQDAQLLLKVGLDLSTFRNQLATIGTQLGGQRLGIGVEFNKQTIADQYRLLSRYIGGKTFKVTLESNLESEIRAADRLVKALDRVQQAASATKGTLPIGTSNLAKTKAKGGFSAAEIKTLFNAAIQGGLLDEKTLGKTRTQMVAALGSIGRDVMAGLLNGLESGNADLKKAAEMIGVVLISTTKSILGIASPSRVFKEIGSNVGKGFELGAVASMDKAFDALEQKLQARLKKLQSILSLAPSRRSAFPFIATGGGLESGPVAREIDQAYAQISQIQRRRQERLSSEREALAQSAGRLLPPARDRSLAAARETIFPGGGAVEQVSRRFIQSLRDTQDVLSRNFSANTYLPRATRNLAASMDAATKQLTGTKIAGLLPSKEMMEPLRFQRAMQEAARIDKENALEYASQQQAQRRTAVFGPASALGGQKFQAPNIAAKVGTNVSEIMAGTKPIADKLRAAAVQYAQNAPAVIKYLNLFSTAGGVNIADLPGPNESPGQYIRRIQQSLQTTLKQGGFGAGTVPQNVSREYFQPGRGPQLPGMPLQLALPPAGGTGGTSDRVRGVGQPPDRGGALALAGGPSTRLPEGHFENVRKYNAALDIARATSAKFTASQIPLIGGLREVAGEFGFAIKQVLLFGTAYKGLAFVTSLPGQILDAAKSQQQYNNSLKTATQDTGTFAKELLYVDNVQRAFGLNLETTRTGFTRLYASMAPTGFDSGSIEKLFTGISAATAALQLTPDKAERVIYAFGQMASKGQIMSEELKGQLGDVLPGALAIFAKAAGMSVKEFSKAMEDGVFVGGKFREVFAKVSDELMTRFGTGAQAAGKSLQGLLNTIGGDFQRTLESFAPLANSAAQAVLVPLGSALRQLSTSAQIAMGEIGRTEGQIEQARKTLSETKSGGGSAKDIRAAEQSLNTLLLKQEALNEALKDPAIAKQVQNIQEFTKELAKAGTFVMNMAKGVGDVLSPVLNFLGANLTSVAGGLFALYTGFQTTRLTLLLFSGALIALRGILAGIGIIKMAIEMGSLTGAMKASGVTAKILASVFQFLGVQAGASSVALIGVKWAMVALLSATVIGALIAGVGLLAGAFMTMGDKAKEAAEKTKRSMDAVKDAVASGNVELVKMEVTMAKLDVEDASRTIKELQKLKEAAQRGNLRSAGIVKSSTLRQGLKDQLNQLGIDFNETVSLGVAISQVQKLREEAMNRAAQAQRKVPLAQQRAEKLGLNKPTPGAMPPETEVDKNAAKIAREQEKLANQQQQLAIDAANRQNALDKAGFDHKMNLAEALSEHGKKLQDAKLAYELAGMNSIEARQRKHQDDLQQIELKRIETIRKARAEEAKAAFELLSAQRTASAASGGRAAPGGLPKGMTSYITGDPSSQYYKKDHGGSNYHEHMAFASRALAEAAYQRLTKAGVKVTEFKGYGRVGTHTRGSAHYSGLAFDVPGAQVPVGQERGLTARVQSIMGIGGAGGAYTRQRRGGKAEGTLQVEQQQRLNKGLETENEVRQANIRAIEETKAAIAQNMAAIFPIAEQKLENDLLMMRNQLQLQGMPEEYIQFKEKSYKADYEGRIALEKYNTQLANLRELVKPLQEKKDKGIITEDETLLFNYLTKQITEYNQRIVETPELQRRFNDELARTASIAAQSPIKRISEAYANVKTEVAKLANWGYQTVEAGKAIGSSFGQAFKDIASGSKSAQDALASMMQSIADHFLDMAAQIIAQQITMMIYGVILKALGVMGSFASAGQGLSGAGALTPGVGSNLPTSYAGVTGVTGGLGSMGGGGGFGSFTSFGVAPFANGGMVTGPTLGLIGEGKYNEAIVPLPDGRSIPVQLQDSSVRDRMNGSSSIGAPVLNMSFQSQTINGVEYVSRDQLEAAMAETRRQASRDGAQRGMTMTLDRLQQSPRTRSRLGMR